MESSKLLNKFIIRGTILDWVESFFKNQEAKGWVSLETVTSCCVYQ